MDTISENILNLMKTAYSQRNAGDIDNALKTVRKVIKSCPAFCDGLLLAGELFFETERYEEAEKYLLEAVKNAPGSFPAHFLLGRLYEAADDNTGSLAHFRECSKIDPQESEPYYFMGIVTEKMSLTSECETFLRQAVNLLPDNWLYRVTLAEFLYTQSRHLEGINLIEDYASEYVPSLLNTLAKGYMLAGNEEKARSYYSLSLSADPGQGDVINTLKQLRDSPPPKQTRKKKLVFVTRIDTFLHDIMRRLEPFYEVKLIWAQGLQDIHEAMREADILWFEWCDDLIAAATKLPKKCPVVCRLHAYEVFTDFPAAVDWSKVDRLITVSRSVNDLLAEKFSISAPVRLIYNGLDFDRYQIPPNKKYGKKICTAGFINYKKNPSLLMQCYKALHDYDPGYTFHHAGKFQDHRFVVYMRDMMKKMGYSIEFSGWSDNMPAYFADKDFVISASFFESFHYAIAEGTACGLMPLVHKWMGCEQFYPEESFFITPEDFVNKIKSYESANRAALAKRFRNALKDKFSLNDQIQKIRDLLAELG